MVRPWWCFSYDFSSSDSGKRRNHKIVSLVTSLFFAAASAVAWPLCSMLKMRQTKPNEGMNEWMKQVQRSIKILLVWFAWWWNQNGNEIMFNCTQLFMFLFSSANSSDRASQSCNEFISVNLSTWTPDHQVARITHNYCKRTCYQNAFWSAFERSPRKQSLKGHHH